MEAADAGHVALEDDTSHLRADTAWAKLVEQARALALDTLTPAVRMQRAGQLLRRLPKGAVLGNAAREAEPLAADADVSEGVLALCCMEDLEAAVALLHELAKHLPHAQVKAEVLHRLATGPKAMLDFSASVEVARFVSLLGLRGVMKLLANKKLSVADGALAFVEHLSVVADDFERLVQLPVRGVGARETLDLKADTEQVLVFALLMMAEVAEELRASGSAVGAAGMLHNGIVCRMLDLRRKHITDGMRNAAIDVVRGLVRIASLGDVAEPEKEALTRELVRYAWPALLAIVNTYYTLRCPAASGETVVSPMRSLVKRAYRTLADIAALALRHKMLPWPVVEDAILAWQGLAPGARAQFWSVASLGYKQLATELLALIIRTAPELVGAEVPVASLIRAWIVMVAQHLMMEDLTGDTRQAVRKLTEALQLPQACAKLSGLFEASILDPGFRGDVAQSAESACKLLDKAREPDTPPEMRNAFLQTGRMLTDTVAKSQCVPFLNPPRDDES